MPDDSYIGALRGALRTFRTLATMFGRLDREIEEAWDSHDVEQALYLEKISAEYADRRRPLAKSLLSAISLLEEASGRLPNPRWVSPLWLLQGWEAICGRQES